MPVFGEGGEFFGKNNSRGIVIQLRGFQIAPDIVFFILEGTGRLDYPGLFRQYYFKPVDFQRVGRIAVDRYPGDSPLYFVTFFDVTGLYLAGFPVALLPDLAAYFHALSHFQVFDVIAGTGELSIIVQFDGNPIHGYQFFFHIDSLDFAPEFGAPFAGKLFQSLGHENRVFGVPFPLEFQRGDIFKIHPHITRFPAESRSG